MKKALLIVNPVSGKQVAKESFFAHVCYIGWQTNQSRAFFKTMFGNICNARIKANFIYVALFV